MLTLPTDFPTEVLTDPALSSKVAGKLVLIGTSATGLLDLKATPAGAMPGVAVHAQLLETILSKSALERWTHSEVGPVDNSTFVPEGPWLQPLMVLTPRMFKITAALDW